MNEKHLKLLNLPLNIIGAPVSVVDLGYDPRTVPTILPLNFAPGERVELHGTSGTYLLQEYAYQRSRQIPCFAGSSQLNNAVKYCADNGIKLINCSLRDVELSPESEQLCLQHQITIQKSAGNLDEKGVSVVRGSNSPCIIYVGAYETSMGRMDSDSAVGPEVFVSMPSGWDIKLYNGKVVSFGDTSCAAFICSIVLSKYMALFPNATIEDRKNFLRSNSTPLPGVSRDKQGAGLFRWTNVVTPPPPPEETAPPEKEDTMIFIGDPGHGGSDPGAVSNGVRECDINLAIALKVEELLKPVQGIQFYLTRRKDETVSLDKRVSTANNIGADYFISFHCDASTDNPNADWITIYCYKFGGKGEILANTLAHALGATKPVREGNHQVTRETKMPAALMELGFITNALNAKKLAHPDYQLILARGIAKGMCKMAGVELPEDMSWKEKLIEQLVTEGLLDKKRSPEEPVTWWEFASVIGRLLDRK